MLSKLTRLSAVLLCVAVLGVHAEDKAAKARAKLSATFSTDHFVVHYDPSDPYLAKIMARGAEEHLTRIAKSLGCRLDKVRPFPLYIYPTHMGFIEAGQLESRKFTLGLAYSDETISIDASGVFESADKVMAHEITHAVIFRILGKHSARLPLWFHEGLAEHESQEYADRAATTAADAAAEGSLIMLRNLRETFPEKRTELAYAESFLAVRYLVDNHGVSAPRKILAEIAAGNSFDEALRNVIGIGETAFENRWHEFTTARYRTLRLTRVGGAIISVIMACLAVLAFLARRKQKIEAARQWEMEEFEEAMRKQLGNNWRE